MSRKGEPWKRWAVVILVVALVAAGGSCYFYAGSRAVARNTQEGSVKTASVRRGELTLSATGAGVVVPVNEVDVGFSVDGTLAEVAVKVVDEVNEGDVLAKVDDLDLQQAVASAQQQLIKAKIDLEAAQQSRQWRWIADAGYARPGHARRPTSSWRERRVRSTYPSLRRLDRVATIQNVRSALRQVSPPSAT
jgi:multidrug efflux pump subunit AcrA (membrane-fusion protein)